MDAERVAIRSHLPLCVGALLLIAASAAHAQDTAVAVARNAPGALRPGSAAAAPAEDASPALANERSTASRAGRFLLGAAAALGAHEGGHLLADGLFGVRPVVKKVDFYGVPFFAITHAPGQPPRREFTISSAGFWMQHLSSEIILVRRPGLRDEQAPFRKGWLAFNVLASLAYGTAAVARVGPIERDTRAMAESLGVHEAWVGALVLAPAGLDAWRYAHPHARWAKWVSRGMKIGMVLLVARAR